MASHQLDEEAIFHVAREILNPEVRATYLNQICVGDKKLRERVDVLLMAHENEQSFLKSNNSEPAATADLAPISERQGTVIGRYRLMEQIGEGGMGIVFVAEQEKPLQRKVALKVIKPGMDTKAVIARFEAERQALALMDHPNIARVFDAGTTETGRPYFVMELVRGVPITEYCDHNKLTIRERLELFVQVCHAIQHAHLKGIIHRDIKPTNVLVTLHDGTPVPKVIDFGVAKALHQRLTERTIYTSFAQVVGTPLYMSPEQAELSGLDIDTRSDVYSLGVLLYELLSGTTPIDREQFERAAYDEIRRIIRETDPPRPSTKISSLGETASFVSAQRGTDPRSLSRFVTGDLDVIVMKALEKDRTHRYETASGLADDVCRFLRDEPIVAVAPSLRYRFVKFARRNRVAVVTTAVVLVSLLLGIFATTLLLVQSRQRLHALANACYEQAIAFALSGHNDEANEAITNAEVAGISSQQVTVIRGLIANSKGDYETAKHCADESIGTEPTGDQSLHVAAISLLVASCGWSGDSDRWEMHLDELRRLTPRSDADYLLKAYAMVMSDPDEAISILSEKPRLDHSAVGLFIRSQSRNMQAVDRQDALLMEEVLHDFRNVRFLFQNSRATLSWHLSALAVAIEMAKRDGRREDKERYVREAVPLADKLGQITGFSNGDVGRWLYYRAIGSQAQASNAIRQVGHYRGGDYYLYLAADFISRPDVLAATHEFENVMDDPYKQNKWVRLARAHLVRDLPDGEAQVRSLVGDLVIDPSPLICRHALNVLCLVERPERVNQLAETALKTILPAYAAGDLWNGQACVEYLTGRVPDAAFLQGAGEHLYSQANVHFTMAMVCLARGDRVGAHHCLVECVATNTLGSFDYELGRAYLARMDANPSWPQWLSPEPENNTVDSPVGVPFENGE